MIRRELKLESGQAQWLLVSQVEHARVSGELARHWVIEGCAKEAQIAIAHHDDGWAEWEARPRIDPVEARPYSFLNEMPRSETREIWDRSIAAARQIGPLAGWMVAEHFAELAATEHRHDDWLREWLTESEKHTEQLAKRSLRLLQACDYLSLWLCRMCPVAADEVVERVGPLHIEWFADGLGPIDFSAQRRVPLRPNYGDPFADSGWDAIGRPWPFDSAELRLAADACVVPIQRYGSTDELLAARRPVRLHWQLVS
jgi:hypothetical protein